MSQATVAATIPAYQAGASVGRVVERTLRLVGNELAELLVVDDGSTDDTADVARRSGARVISHPVNRGKGCALATAFSDLFARGHAAVVTLDADGQHLPEEIPHLTAAWRSPTGGGEADLVIGSRTHLFAEMRWLRRYSNRISSSLISLAAGQRLADVQSGFRLYGRRLIELIGLPEPRFEAESAVAVRAIRCGARVVTVPIDLGFADGLVTSHYRPVVDSLRIARAVVRARLESPSWTRVPSS